MTRGPRTGWILLVLCLFVGISQGLAHAMPLGGWSPPISAETGLESDAALNTEWVEGCPAVSADGLSLYLASNRPDPAALGGLDIYVARRDSNSDGWGAPVNLGPTINSSAADFCPSPTRDGHSFFFVSERPGGCSLGSGTGTGDIYRTRQASDGTWATPTNLGCDVNSPLEEASPSLIDGNQLYFSSNRSGVGSDIYVSWRKGNGEFAAPTLAPGLNTTFLDFQPNVRRDGREIFFVSNRSPGGQGAADIWTSTRTSRTGTWTPPVNLGATVNSTGPDTRPFLSWDLTTLYFGSTRPPRRGGVQRPVPDDPPEGDRPGLKRRRSQQERLVSLVR